MENGGSTMKERMSIRLLSLILCCAMVLGCFPAVSYAENPDGLCTHCPEHTEGCDLSKDPSCGFECALCEAGFAGSLSEQVEETDLKEDSAPAYPWEGLPDGDFAAWLTAEENREYLRQSTALSDSECESLLVRIEQMADPDLMKSLYSYLDTVCGIELAEMFVVQSAAAVYHAAYTGVDYTKLTSNPKRIAALNKAKQMATIVWTAPCDFPTWVSSEGVYNATVDINGNVSSTCFQQGHTYQGIPYSMSLIDSGAGRRYEDNAWTSLLNSGSMTTASMSTPRAGNGKATTARGIDCSYFVSAAINAGTGSNLNLTTSDMLSHSNFVLVPGATKSERLQNMLPGDLFLKSGHVMMFAGVTSSSRYGVFESCTTYSKCQYTEYSPSSLSSYDCYRYTGFGDSSSIPVTYQKNGSLDANKLQSIQNKFPGGKYWNHLCTDPSTTRSESYNNSVTSSPCSHTEKVGYYDCNHFDGGGQCAGYARRVAYEYFGTKSSTWSRSYNVSSLKPGDIVRYKPGNNLHSIWVTAINGETVTFTDCNFSGPCQIRWNATTTLSKIESTLEYIESSPGTSIPPTPSPSNEIDTRFNGFVPFNTYAVSTGKVTLYKQDRTAYSTSVRYIDGSTDKCTINEIYSDGFCSVTYPTKSGSNTELAKISDFIPDSSSPTSWTANSYYDAYRRSSGSETIGSVSSGDRCLALGSANGRTQVIYPTSSGHKMGWVDTSIQPTMYTVEILHYYGDFKYSEGSNASKKELLVRKSQYTVEKGAIFTLNAEKLLNTPNGMKLNVICTPSISGEWNNYPLGTSFAVNGDASIEFHYLTEEYSITYQLDGGINSSANPSTYNVFYGVTLQNPSKLGWSFAGWKDKNGNVITGINQGKDMSFAQLGGYDAIYTELASRTSGNLTLSAVWKENGHNYSYKLTYPPTYTTEGRITGSCSKCGGTTNIALPKLDTTNYSYSVLEEPTCLSEGTGRYTWHTTTYGSYSFDVVLEKLKYENLGEDFLAMIAHFDSWKKVFSVNGNAQLASGEKTNDCEWHFVRLNDGSYEIYSMENGQALTVQDSEAANTSNVQVTNYIGGDSQRWYIQKYYGAYELVPKCAPHFRLNLLNGSAEENQNIQVCRYTGENNRAELFRIILWDDSVFGSQAYRNLGKSFYALILKSDIGKIIGVNEWDYVTLQTETAEPGLIWKFELQENGSYKISNCKNGKVLEVANGSAEKGAYLKLNDSNNSAAQRWYLYGSENNYVLRPMCSNCCMDVCGNMSADGTQIETWEYTGGSAQKFEIQYADAKYQPTTVELTVVSGQATFVWEPNDWAQKYNIRIFKDKIYEGADYSKLHVTGSSCTVPLIPGHYYAYVDSVSGLFWRQSNILSFEIGVCGHNYTYSLSSSPTLSATGKIIGTCSWCDSTTTVIMPKLNNTDYAYSVATMATCTTAGTDRYTWKNTSYGIFSVDVPIAKLAHQYQYTITTAPTPTSSGVLTETCSSCGETTRHNFPMLDTTNYTYKVVKSATCTSAGTGRYTWNTTVYGTYDFDVVLEPMGHLYQNGSCTICGEKDPYCLAFGWSGDLSWGLMVDGVLTFSGSGAMKNYPSEAETPWYSYASQISSVIIESGVTGIGNYAFYGIPNLQSIQIPATVTRIGNYAIKNAGIVYGNPNAAMKLSLPKGTAAVEDGAFQDCVTLESVLVPASVKGIGALAFDGCTGLNAIVFSGSAPAIAADAFAGVTATVYYPENDTTWTPGIMQSYGGTLIWVPYAE